MFKKRKRRRRKRRAAIDLGNHMYIVNVSDFMFLATARLGVSFLRRCYTNSQNDE